MKPPQDDLTLPYAKESESDTNRESEDIEVPLETYLKTTRWSFCPLPSLKNTHIPKKCFLWVGSTALLAIAALGLFLGLNRSHVSNQSSQNSAVQEFDCPIAGDYSPYALDDLREGAWIRLNNYDDGVCNLWLIGPENQRKPLARSYLGQPWEKYAGPLAKEIDFQCEKSSCLIILPVPSVQGQYYEISSFQLPSSSTEEPLSNDFDDDSVFDSDVSIECPSTNQSPLPLGYIRGPVVATLRIAEEGLCTLWKVGPGTKRMPVARSYDNNGWEVYANSMAHQLSFSCQGKKCRTTLPELTDPTQFYEIASFDSLNRSREVQVARFLEQATFGPTVATINSFPEYYADWIEDQMTMEYFSHRKFFRSRAHARKSTTSEQGVPTHPCEAGSYYRKYAMDTKDLNYYVEITTHNATKRRIMSRDGQARTVFTTPTLKAGRNQTIADGTYQICELWFPKIGNTFKLDVPGVGCVSLFTANNLEIGHPRVYFDNLTPPTNPYAELDNKAVVISSHLYPDSENDQLLILTADLDDEVCSMAPNVTSWPPFVVVGRFNGELYMHDARTKLYENTLESPLPDGGGTIKNYVAAVTENKASEFITQCATPEMTFLNEATCYLSTSDNACSASLELDDTTKVQAKVELTPALFQILYESDEGLYYAVTGLRQDEGVPYDPPCSLGTRSRWIPLANYSGSCSHGSPGTTTVATFSALLGQSTDSNPYLRDVFTSAAGTICDSSDQHSLDFQVLVDGQCWQNVHQDHLQVFDFSEWVRFHPGGSAALLQFTEKSEGFSLSSSPYAVYHLAFPATHSMSRWHDDGSPYRTRVGRLGDVVQLLLRQAIVDEIGGEVVGTTTTQVIPGIVCGSPNEVATEPSLAQRTDYREFDTITRRNMTGLVKNFDAQKLSIWIYAALNAPDQLRQRIAWALSQLLVITPSDVTASSAHMTEAFVAYYDIFVRHAFGNYRDVLREVTFSPLMGEMLSYSGSRSTAYIWESEQRLEYADENFAREVLQLFSIGLYRLNTDGTLDLDASGNDQHTYTDEELREYARVFTGFNPAIRRGNIENNYPNAAWNPVDPMVIDLATHDRLPKLGLDGQYVGDGLPLCRDLPNLHFLRRGARYRLLGRNPTPVLLTEPTSWQANPAISRIQVDETSALYQKLCSNMNANDNSCFFQGIVELDEDIPCDGTLCDIEAPRVVEVGAGIFYEYIRPPCSRFAFFSDGRVMTTYGGQLYCEDISLQEGGVSCCKDGISEGVSGNLFNGERVSYGLAQNRCEGSNDILCASLPSSCRESNTCDTSVGHWTTLPCSVQIKIDPEGRVGIVHDTTAGDIAKANVIASVREDTKTFVRVEWNDQIQRLLSAYETVCSELGCQRDARDNLCLCSTTTLEEPAFSAVPSREEVLSLPVGVFERNFDNLVGTEISAEVKMYSTTGDIGFSSIFEVIDHNGMIVRRQNIKSAVLVGNSSDLSFRNPAHVVGITSPELRDVHNEIEATIDHCFFHKNMPPFLAIRFAQRFGISNPSPRYVREMAVAFRNGTYVDSASSKIFGSGKYGDIGALVAAMLLDREARNEDLDLDPTSGSLLEPFLRLIRVFRSLEWEGDSDRPFVDFSYDLQTRIGQQPYQMPSVFSFFLPEYHPGGAISDASLLCPECQELTGPSSIALVNGMLSLIKYGLDIAYGGLGVGRLSWKPTEGRALGTYKWASGKLTYQPEDYQDAATVVQQLSLLLTAGRLRQEKLAILEDAYKTSLDAMEGENALINLEQLIVTTPEFHANGMSDNSKGLRPDTKNTTASKPYKAMVFLMLNGGYDSYNLLVPTNCSGNDLVNQYSTERGSIALTDEEMELLISATDQPCEEFAVHPALPFVKEMYDAGELSFFANTGVFTTTNMTNANYLSQVPFQLSAHNEMERETNVMDGFNVYAGSGVMGRISAVLTANGYSTNSIAVDGAKVAVQPEEGTAPEPIVVSRFGAHKFGPRPDTETLDIMGYSATLNAETSDYSSLFGEMWSSTFVSAIVSAARFREQFASAQLGNQWPDEVGSTVLEKLRTVSKLIQTKDQRNVDRDFFKVDFSGWDHHSNVKASQEYKFVQLNNALELFVEEMKAQGNFEDVTVIVTSEFGRTLTPNSGAGSDHAWGGNYFMFGGSVDGRRIHGNYPDDISATSALNLGRGRLLPTTSWDCIWNGVSEWLGVEEDKDLDYILPNRLASSGSYGSMFSPLFSRDDMFIS